MNRRRPIAASAGPVASDDMVLLGLPLIGLQSADALGKLGEFEKGCNRQAPGGIGAARGGNAMSSPLAGPEGVRRSTNFIARTAWQFF